MWGSASNSLRSAFASLKRALRGPVRSVSTLHNGGSLSLRLCAGVPQASVKAKSQATFPVSRFLNKQVRNNGLGVGRSRVPGLTPLMALGGLSPITYMAVEATEGHFPFLSSWSVDLSKDLSRSLAEVAKAQKELAAAKDRIEDLEMMVNDLTVFIEMKKDEIARLKQGVVQELD